MEISVTTIAIRSGLALWLKECRTRLAEFWRTRHKPRSLRIQETAALGDRRFVAVLQFERQRFLIGATASSVTLLAHLPEQEAGEQTAR